MTYSSDNGGKIFGANTAGVDSPVHQILDAMALPSQWVSGGHHCELLAFPVSACLVWMVITATAMALPCQCVSNLSSLRATRILCMITVKAATTLDKTK